MPPRKRPDHLKALSGTEDRYRNPNEPKPAPAVADLTVPPRGLGAKPSAVWRRLSPDLVAKRMLTPWDVDMFAAFCVAVAQYGDARRAVAKEGLVTQGSQGQPVVSPYLRAQKIALEAMTSLGGRFGLSPSDRANISLVADLVVNPTAPGAPLPPAGPERLLG